MVVSLQAHETLYLSMKVVEPRLLPPSMLLKWRGLRGLVITERAVGAKGAAGGSESRINFHRKMIKNH